MASLLAALALLPGGALGSSSDPLKDWREGPVRYLMTRQEWRQFRDLKTPAARLDFIRNFWDRRDPDPRTPQNEARLTFWWRVMEANRRFGDTPLPGWKTDRGKIFILLGPPDDIEKKEYYDAQIRSIANRGLMRWHYRGLERAAVRAATVVAFLRGNDDDWYLTDDARFNSPTFDIHSPVEELGYSGMDRLLEQLPWKQGSLGTALDLGRLQEIPAEREILRAVVDAEQFLGTLRLAVEVHLLSDPQGKRLHAITAALPRRELFPPWDGAATSLALRFGVTAALRSRDGKQTLEIPEEAFVTEPAPAPEDPYLRIQALRPLPPGDWQLSLVVFDRPGGGAGTATRDLLIPPEAPAGTPCLEGPVLVGGGFAAAASAPGGGAFPFHWANQGVVPRVFRPYAAGEKIRAAFRVAGSAAAGEVAHRLETGAGDPVLMTSPPRLERQGELQFLEVDSASLVPGSYRLWITIPVPGGPDLQGSVEFEVLAG